MECQNPNCNKETKNPKFCSRSCSVSTTNLVPKRKIARRCANCDNLIKDWRSSHFSSPGGI